VTEQPIQPSQPTQPDLATQPALAGEPDELMAETAERLRALEAKPPTEHADVYDEIHRRLAGRLDESREG
jgi:hypothetical protein